MAEHVRTILRRGLPEGEWHSVIFEEDLDRGLERCEDLVITEWGRVHLAVEPCRTVLMTLSARRSLERDDLALTVELDRYLIDTILEYRARLLSVPPNAPE